MPKHMEGEDAFEKMEEMFKEYSMGAEYEKAFEAIKADWERVCRENREMRIQLHKSDRRVAV